jgi:hypothetical protein
VRSLLARRFGCSPAAIDAWPIDVVEEEIRYMELEAKGRRR